MTTSPHEVILRPYQHEAIGRVRDAYRAGSRAVLLVLPTGGGKTIVFSHAAASALNKGKRVLVLVHRRELVRQASAKLAEAGVPHGIIAPGHPATSDPVQVASVQALARRLGKPNVGAFDLLILDEGHHAVAGQWRAVIKAFPAARLLGVTATPQRADGLGLGRRAGGPFDALVLGPSVADLTAAGFLVTARVFAPADLPDLSNVRIRGGDYEQGGLAAAMSAPALVGDAVAHYRQHAEGRPAVAFCASIGHAEATAEVFRQAGYRAVAASGNTQVADRDAAIAGLATGQVQVLCSCDLISEGLDVPAVAAVILLRPTKSLALYLQQVGRGLRTVDPEKCPGAVKRDCIVLDHAGNTLTFGMPDAYRRWSLDGQKRRKREQAPSGARRCGTCGAVCAVSAPCPECGAEASLQARQVQHADGTLLEMGPAERERLLRLQTRPLGALVQEAGTFADMCQIARARGYRPGWAHLAWKERQEAAGA